MFFRSHKLIAILTLFLLLPVFPEDKSAVRYVLITSGSLNVREAPETGKVLFGLTKGAKVHIVKEEPSEWVKIKTEDGRTGFVSRKYLGSTPPDTLDTYRLLGFVSAAYDPKELPIFVPLAFYGPGGWQVAKEEYEFDYKFRSGVKETLPSVALVTGENGPDFLGDAATTYGCQELPALKVKPSKSLDSKNIYVVYSPELGLKSIALQELTTANSTDFELYKTLAGTVWKAKGFSEAEWLKVQIQEVYEFKTPKKETFISGRIAYVKNNAERKYLYLLARKSGPEKVLIAFEYSDKLTEEIGMYGGSYHLNGIVYRSEDPTPVLIFTDIGYDASIHSLFELRNGTLHLLLHGGGDAC
ncbi:hypothetical protein CH373_02440 [Leptospira perolatii]|uniref:SH3b domain-containing protein n=1 Tax=Leptospira perolatii TaxID=2023191 RepID=A0A2M9ZSG3_9LEPT|nr:SH3 domain-containing protein [Leptospira perolatii]PJZ71377.1 hypothetical protein CH360_02440 [Leptospira perolatii]PJZ74911.1 hypothetical protein CH373_02440 [Leptospira perolatii]